MLLGILSNSFVQHVGANQKRRDMKDRFSRKFPVIWLNIGMKSGTNLSLSAS